MTVSKSSRQSQPIAKVPEFQKINPFILRGYRVNYSWQQLLLSLFGWHNETVNVWTHLLPFLCILTLVFSSSVAVQHYHDRHEIAAYAREVEAQRNIFAAGHSLNTSLEAESEHSSALLDHVVRFYLTPVSAISRSVDQLMRLTVEDRLPIRDTIANTGRKIEEIGHELNQLMYLKVKSNTTMTPNPIHQENIMFHLVNSQTTLTDYSTLLIESIQTLSMRVNPTSKWPITFYLFCVSVALSCSAVYHLFSAYSPKVFKILSNLDFAGVAMINLGSSFPGIMYASQCNTTPAILYLPVLTILNLGAFIFGVTGRINNPPPVYGTLGLLNIIPISHFLIVEHFFGNFGDPLFPSPFVLGYMLGGVFLIGGLAMMVLRCPQRHSPGTFDLCGAGHQIWHVCSVIGIVIQLATSWEYYHLRRLNPCPVEYLG